MTLLEMRTNVWEDLGEPPNCDPATATGLARLNRWINSGYKKILFWKFPDGTQVRFPATEGEIYFQTVAPTGTIVASTTATVTLASTAGAHDDQYNGWTIETTEGTRLIVDYDGMTKTATVSSAFGTAPTGTYTLTKNWMRLSESTDDGASENIILSSISEVKAIQRIVLLDDQTEILPAQRTETFAQGLLSPGRPSLYLVRGKRIFFDVPVEEALWFSMEYARIPPDMALDSDEPELPEDFHEAIEMWARWKGFIWSQETDMAWAVKQDLMDFMRTTKAPIEMASDRENAYFEVEGF